MEMVPANSNKIADSSTQKCAINSPNMVNSEKTTQQDVMGNAKSSTQMSTPKTETVWKLEEDGKTLKNS